MDSPVRMEVPFHELAFLAGSGVVGSPELWRWKGLFPAPWGLRVQLLRPGLVASLTLCSAIYAQHCARAILVCFSFHQLKSIRKQRERMDLILHSAVLT